MKKTIPILAFAAAFLLASLAMPQGQPAGGAAKGDAAQGKALFHQDGCFECHGYVGQGTKDGARIGPPVLNLQGLIRYVRRPAGQMPAYTAKVVTDEQLTDIYAYLKSVPAPKAIKDIPLLEELK
jgi:ubiquinol-cytochrome c reductase cytochrome c subunit